jgi:hypothetical protein
MKYVLLSALCLCFSGCANTSNGGGWIVGNGMTDQGTAQDGMKTFGSSDEGTAIVTPQADCGCDPKSEDCDCKLVQPKKRKHKR